MISPKEFRDASDERIARDAPGTDLRVHQIMTDMVRVAMRLDHDYDRQIHRPRGISYAGFRVLFCLWATEPLQGNELAALLGVTPATMSSVLNTLEQRGLVERERDDADRRAVQVRLTDEGMRIVADGFAAMHDRARAWMDDVPERDQVVFARVLAHLATRKRPPHP